MSTQQFIRVSTETLERCADDADFVRRLLNLEGVEKSHYRDLDWWPSYLKKMLAYAKASAEIETTLNLALDGADTLTSSDWGLEFDEPPTYIRAAKVTDLSENLAHIDIAHFVRRLPSDLPSLNQVLKSDFSEDPSSLLINSYQTLVGFYQEASNERQAIITWWA